MGSMDTKTSKTEQPRPHDDYYLGWILKIAAAANVELSEATLAVYLERLRKLTADEMSRAATLSIEDWSEPSKMPPLSFILERASRVPEVTETVDEITDRYQAQLEVSQEREAIQAMTNEARKHGISEADIATWLEFGKKAQREHITTLMADPQWRALRDRVVSRDFKPKLTEVPTDPEERKAWATEKAAPWRKL